MNHAVPTRGKAADGGVPLVALRQPGLLSLRPFRDGQGRGQTCSTGLTFFDLFKSFDHNLRMKPASVRTSIDLPRDLHRRLHEAAARKGCSARKLILAGIERAVEETKSSRPKRRLSLDPPLIRPAGRRIAITNEEAYELIELP